MADQRLERTGARRSRGLANVSINGKFMLVIAVAALAAVGVGISAFVGMASMSADSEYMYSQNLVPIDDLGEMQRSSLAMRVDVLSAALATNAAAADGFLAKLPGEDSAFDKAFADYTSADMTGRETDVAAAHQAITDYRTARDARQIPAVRAHDSAAFNRVRDAEIIPATTKLATALGNLVKIETNSADSHLKSAESTYSNARTVVVVVLVVGLVLAIAAGLYFARLVAVPVRKVGAVIAAISGGDLTRTADVASRDEVGRMAQALDEATSNLRESLSVVSGSSHSLASASEELSSTSQQIGTSAEQTASQAESVSAAAEQVSRNVQTVAASAEEMSASIREIATNASEAATVAHDAVQLASAVRAAMAQLRTSSSEIGNVIGLITSIAEQTNLLALNATIEAARAGDAGKGFAVVASEVKDLAQETSKATGDISQRVETIQSDSAAAESAISEIVEVIERINGYSTTIASAVEEQTSTTGEIGRNVTEAAVGANQIAESITSVATASQVTTGAVGDSARTADEVARMASELQQVVGRFTV